MMKKMKIIIMDTNTNEIHIFDYNPNVWGFVNNGEDFVTTHFSEQGQTFVLENCKWMLVDMDSTENRLPIYIH